MSDTIKVKFTSTEEMPDEPLLFTSKFKTIHEWLAALCQGSQPTVKVDEFRIFLSRTTMRNGRPVNEYTASLYGTITSYPELNHSYTRVVFEPANMYFKFPGNAYKKFTFAQMKDELTARVKAFIKTDEFRNSFLSKAQIRMNFQAEPIWIAP